MDYNLIDANEEEWNSLINCINNTDWSDIVNRTNKVDCLTTESNQMKQQVGQQQRQLMDHQNSQNQM